MIFFDLNGEVCIVIQVSMLFGQKVKSQKVKIGYFCSLDGGIFLGGWGGMSYPLYSIITIVISSFCSAPMV